jgi:hypothetical protein
MVVGSNGIVNLSGSNMRELNQNARGNAIRLTNSFFRQCVRVAHVFGGSRDAPHHRSRLGRKSHFPAWHPPTNRHSFRHQPANNHIEKENMNDRDIRREERATRVQTFGVENDADFAAGGKAKTHFGNLDGFLVQLGEAKAGQTPNRVTKSTLFDALGLDLQNIARTARRIEQKENGFAAPYRIPDKTSESAVTTHTDAVRLRLEDQPADSGEVNTAKAALRARFIEYELPDDFVAHLRADRKAIAGANRLNQGEIQGGVENTELIGQLLDKINGEIGELDAIMYNKYTRQPEKLRAWQSASHVERAPQREKKTPTPPTPPSS